MNNVGQRRHRYAGTRDKAHSPRACAQAATFSSDTPVASRFETRRLAGWRRLIRGQTRSG
jgi:hypothetical protein